MAEVAGSNPAGSTHLPTPRGFSLFFCVGLLYRSFRRDPFHCSAVSYISIHRRTLSEHEADTPEVGIEVAYEPHDRVV